MRGTELIEALRRKLATEGKQYITDKVIADHLGITVQALYSWRKGEAVSVRQMVGLLYKTQRKAASTAETQAIKPIVEFFRINAVSKNGGRVDVFDTYGENEEQHPYRNGLRAELEKTYGIYIFHDSRGRALYVGKARSQTLWREVNNAFNRDRGAIQGIRRVDHPERRQDFRTVDEKRRQIRLRQVPLRDLARYVSAYEVSPGLIGNLESLLIRSFANDLLNVRMENFGWETSSRRR
jgi:hypothetical protein